MRNGNKKVLIIVIVAIIILALAGSVFAYMFLATDTFKSAQTLFGKYMQQNQNTINSLLDSKTYIQYEELKNNDIYESETTISATYSEGGEISNPINELALNFKAQKDNEYRYRDAQILFEDKSYLQIEGIREQDVYGIRFSNALKEFLSIRDNGNLAEEAEKIDVDEKTLDVCMSLINNDESIVNKLISKEEIKALTEKYINIIAENINNAAFTKQKKAMITYNNATIKTNAYGVSLDSNQVQNLITQLLNNIKADETILKTIEKENKQSFVDNIDDIIENLGIDEEIPAIKITVYEQKGITVRTVIEIGLETYTLEGIVGNSDTKLKIERKVLNEEKQEEQIIEITKKNEESKEIYNIVTNIIEGESNYIIESVLQTTFNNQKLITTGNIKLEQGIIKASLNLENKVYIGQIENKVEINETNNVVLSDLNEEQRTAVLNVVKTGVPERLSGKMTQLLEKLKIEELMKDLMAGLSGETPEEPTDIPENPNEGENIPEEPQLTQTEINRFNAKFEFYTGDSVSSENVKILLDVVKMNLNSVEFIPIKNNDETNENTQNQEETKQRIKLNIEKDKTNVELANEILNKIEDRNKYKVSIKYKDSNGMIEYITIEDVT